MKRIFALLLVLAFLLPGCSGGKANLKAYDTGMGLELYLPDGFEKFDSDDFAYAISNEDKVAVDSAKMVVFVNYESDDYLKALGGFYKDVKEYGEDVSKEDTIKTSAGMVGDRYVFDYEYDDFYYKVVCLAGNGGYYIVNLCCYKDSKELPAKFDEYAKEIKVTKTSSDLGNKTYTNSRFSIVLPDCFEEEEDNADLYADAVGLRFSLYDEEIYKSKGYSYPETEKEALESFRDMFQDTACEIKNDGDLYYYVLEDGDYAYLYSMKKTADGYINTDAITFINYKDDMTPVILKWLKTMKLAD